MKPEPVLEGLGGEGDMVRPERTIDQRADAGTHIPRSPLSVWCPSCGAHNGEPCFGVAPADRTTAFHTRRMRAFDQLKPRPASSGEAATPESGG